MDLAGYDFAGFAADANSSSRESFASNSASASETVAVELAASERVIDDGIAEITPVGSRPTRTLHPEDKQSWSEDPEFDEFDPGEIKVVEDDTGHVRVFEDDGYWQVEVGLEIEARGPGKSSRSVSRIHGLDPGYEVEGEFSDEHALLRPDLMRTACLGQDPVEERITRTKSEILADLRSKLNQQLSTGHGNFEFSSIRFAGSAADANSSSVASGLPRGALVHISGAHGCGKTELALKFLAENPTLRVAWIEDQFTLYPVSFEQLGAQLGRALFIHSGPDTFWTFSQVLNSQYFEVVVLSSQNLRVSDTELRRWQLMAEKTGCCCLLISENESLTSQGDWSVAMKLEAERTSLNAPPSLRILKSRAQMALGG